VRLDFEMRPTLRSLFFLAVGLLAGSPAWAQDPLNRLSSVKVEEGDDTTRIVVKGEKVPAFTVFKLSDPVRLFIDVSSADLSAIQTPIEVNNGVIGEITTLQFTDDVATVARLIVGLKTDAPYSVKARGNDLVVTIDAAKRTARKPVASVAAAGGAAVAAVADAERRARSAAQKAQEAEARASAAEQRARDAERRATTLAQLRVQDSDAKDAAETAKAAAEAQAAEARASVQEAEARVRVAEARADEARVAEAQARSQKDAGAGANTAALARAREAESRAADAEARAAGLARAVAEAKSQTQAAVARAQQAAAKANARIAATNEAARAAEQRLAEVRSQGGATQARIAAAEESAKAARAAADQSKAQSAAQARAAKTQIAAANTSAAQADARALTAANEAEMQARSAAAAAQKAQKAADRLARAESRADAAETRAAQAEARATAAESDRQRLSAELAAIGQQQADAHAQIVRLEGEQTRLAGNLKTARAAKDAERSKVIEAQERARRSELAAERARLTQLDSAKASSALAQRVTELNTQLQAAEEVDSGSEDAARLKTELAGARREGDTLRGQLKNRDDELSAARSEASRIRQDAERLGAELVTARSSRADAAETRAAQAEARATAAESDRQRLSAELAAIGLQQADARAQIVRLQSQQTRLAGNLKTARAAKDAERSKVIEAEERARRSELAAERARLTQLDSAKASSALAQRVTELNTQLQAAEEVDSASDDAVRLKTELAGARREGDTLRGQLKNRDDELSAARSEASRIRQEAERLGAELVTARSSVTAAPVVVAPPAAATRIVSVKFDDSADRTRIRIGIVGRPLFKTLREGERTRILEFTNARIDPAIERTLDTSEFPSAVQIVSSFQAPPPGERVRVVVTLNEQVGDDVIIEGNSLVWAFNKPAAASAVVSAVPPPPKWAAPIQDLGPQDPVKFNQPKAAVYTGTAQAGFGATRRVKPKKTRRYSGRRINIDIKDGDIHNILRLLAKEGNVNIVTSDDVKGTVTVHLKLVPWDQALDIILRTKSLGMVREGDIIRVAPAKTLAEERDLALRALEVKEKLKPLRVKLISVNYASASDLLPRVRSVLSDRGKAEFDKRTNTVIVNDVIENVEAAEDIISRLDTQTPQVLIEARIVEVNTVNVRQFGIQWGGQALLSPALGNETGLRFPSVVGLRGGADDIQTPSNGTATTPNFIVNLPAQAGGGSGGVLGMTFGSIDGAFNLNVRLSALENRGTVKIVSSPKITTLDNKKATISQGVSIPISQVSAAGTQTVFFDADLKLEVTPQVTQDGNIYLQLLVENNTPDFQNVGARGDPTILKKEAETELLLKDGDTTVIGGIYSSNAGTNTSEVPYLASIPILGALFRNYQENDRRTELLIFITPRIVNRSAAQVRTTR
jgi:type IV pilus assembly protein PilQ